MKEVGRLRMYICPFCKMEVVDTITSLNAHREPGGVCDREMSRMEET